MILSRSRAASLGRYDQRKARRQRRGRAPCAEKVLSLTRNDVIDLLHHKPDFLVVEKGGGGHHTIQPLDCRMQRWLCLQTSNQNTQHFILKREEENIFRNICLDRR